MSISLSSLILLPIWISMAQIQQGGPDEKEKTTALKDLLSRIDLDELMKKDEPPLDFPDTLEGFEYAFNEKGQLRHIKTGEPFVFNYREDLHRWNQKRYEALGEIITKYVYELLEKDCNLKKISIPVDATESEPKSFIFMSEDALTNPQKLMVLIHGSGVVRAGQWARRLIINEDLDSGTQIPFIKRAMDEGYGVIVLNPNENYIEVEKPKIPVQSSSDSSEEPAEKRERKDKVSKETKKRRDFYEKYRNPQREKEMMQLYIRSLSSVRLFATPWTAARQVFLSVTNSWSLLKLTSMNQWCYLTVSSSVVPLSSPSFNLHRISVFSNKSALRIRWPKYAASASTSVLPRVDLLAVPRDSQESSPTPQFKSINSSVLNFLYSPTVISIHDCRKIHNFG
ncbi:cotranscriptional regulator ARB2A isoform X4 [Bubalus kerabau]|uniref:cotranscriptional regulator ARB2A isoform X4 n=1 Tax=Bubalus carabanensis TaxID=3119969 RepID=UPI00244E74BF|nr:cotranscriptional regulator FAM172A isoform X4 [Bubalus carabanensis]